MRSNTRIALMLCAASLALPVQALAVTWYVTNTGVDQASCGLTTANACRSITQAISLAASGDTILVGPGRYGDLNQNGTLGDIAGEETGSPGCGCVLSINKPVIVISTGGAAVTVIDGQRVDHAIQNVLLITKGGEFGRPGKGFTVPATARRDASGYLVNYGIVLDAVNVLVRGNQVPVLSETDVFGYGIVTVNDEPVRIEGNLVQGWWRGIGGRGAAIINKNQLIGNDIGILTTGGKVTGNVLTGNDIGVQFSGAVTITGNAAYLNDYGFKINGAFSGTLTKNNFIGNFCGIENDAYPLLVATNNYWGVATGPGPEPADKACVKNGGTIATNPYATAPFVVRPIKP